MNESSPTFSLVIPVYKNEDTLQSLFCELRKLASCLPKALEVVFVIDGSPDNSYALITRLSSHESFSIRLIEHSRNFGAFAAIRTGISAASGEYFVNMAADLQEPISLIYEMFLELYSCSFDIVLATRRTRKDPPLTTFFSSLFWGIYRKVIMSAMPEGGFDCFGINNQARQALLSFYEPNSSLVSQLLWMGFRRTTISYDRLERERGKSAWTFSKKVAYLVDTLISFSDLPLRIIVYMGTLGIAATTVCTIVVIIAKISGVITVPGYATIVILSLFSLSALLLSQGLLGMYIWRAFENTKKRPLSLISSDCKIK